MGTVSLAGILEWIKTTILIAPAVPSELITFRDRLLGVDKLITRAWELGYLTGIRDGAIYITLVELVIAVSFIFYARWKSNGPTKAV